MIYIIVIVCGMHRMFHDPAFITNKRAHFNPSPANRQFDLVLSSSGESTLGFVYRSNEELRSDAQWKAMVIESKQIYLEKERKPTLISRF